MENEAGSVFENGDRNLLDCRNAKCVSYMSEIFVRADRGSFDEKKVCGRQKKVNIARLFGSSMN